MVHRLRKSHKSHKSHKGGKRRVHKGKGFWDVLKKGASFVKDNGLISKGLQGASAIAGALGKKGLAESLGNHAGTAESFGVGKRRRKRQNGAGFFDMLKKGISFVKDNGLISKGLQGASAIAGALGKKDLADSLGNHAGTAESFGVGRRRRKKQSGSGMFDFLNNIPLLGPIAGGLMNGLTGGKRGHPGHHGKGLNMAGSGEAHTWGNQEYPNNYHTHSRGLVHKGHGLHLAGTGHFGRVDRGAARMLHH